MIKSGNPFPTELHISRLISCQKRGTSQLIQVLIQVVLVVSLVFWFSQHFQLIRIISMKLIKEGHSLGFRLILLLIAHTHFHNVLLSDEVRYWQK